ncbi:hypothetical protein CERZMDRAFT_87158 [Cercospora zeae-maydis SCOH1-5]|uniref:Uncharacterized protein n=1 Tax=Cercospora zeae-maydis SCOH1-5 TaxID=717836 RepID=A0A6A6F5J3_9PEZI|nr:hypothetical protein CERZMDRAFT_87158 [Cercospora zeae-maydis SCOH1-5]
MRRTRLHTCLASSLHLDKDAYGELTSNFGVIHVTVMSRNSRFLRWRLRGQLQPAIMSATTITTFSRKRFVYRAWHTDRDRIQCYTTCTVRSPPPVLTRHSCTKKGREEKRVARERRETWHQSSSSSSSSSSASSPVRTT